MQNSECKMKDGGEASVVVAAEVFEETIYFHVGILPEAVGHLRSDLKNKCENCKGQKGGECAILTGGLGGKLEIVTAENRN